ncbi:Myblike DNAbinding domain-containing protein [Quaeritorhiza haematococci]|nr:Myblike DNAbinding domain-containing protein [Quaeritorhiza haematococci]
MCAMNALTPSATYLDSSNLPAVMPFQTHSNVGDPLLATTSEASSTADLHDSEEPSTPMEFELGYEIASDVGNPRLAQAQKALDLNRQLQERVKKQLADLELALTRNQAWQKRVRTVGTHPDQIRKMHIIRRRPPFFVDKEKNTPPDNEDAIKRKHFQSKVDLIYRKSRWTAPERADLKRGILQETRKLFFFENPDKTPAETPPEKELLSRIEGLNWDNIASFVPTRTPMECQIQWTVNQHPAINKKEFGPDEISDLAEVVQEFGARQWDKIAAKHGNWRVAAQCFRAYQRHINQSHIGKGWSPEEDQRLRDAVNMYGTRSWQSVCIDGMSFRFILGTSKAPFQRHTTFFHFATKHKQRKTKVAYFMNGRTGQQCLHRYMKALAPGKKKGRWSAEEDKKLLEAVKIHGRGNWSKISQMVTTRTDAQCRERYVNVLAPELKTGEFTKEEKVLLKELVAKYGEGSWSKIAKEMPNRTDNQCWREWKKLTGQTRKRAPHGKGAGQAGSRTKSNNQKGKGKASASSSSSSVRSNASSPSSETRESGESNGEDEADGEEAMGERMEIDGDDSGVGPSSLRRPRRRGSVQEVVDEEDDEEGEEAERQENEGGRGKGKVKDKGKGKATDKQKRKGKAQDETAGDVDNEKKRKASEKAAVRKMKKVLRIPTTRRTTTTAQDQSPASNENNDTTTPVGTPSSTAAASANNDTVEVQNDEQGQKEQEEEHIRPFAPNVATCTALERLVRRLGIGLDDDTEPPTLPSGVIRPAQTEPADISTEDASMHEIGTTTSTNFVPATWNRQNFALLQERFNALFAWPMALADVMGEEPQKQAEEQQEEDAVAEEEERAGGVVDEPRGLAAQEDDENVSAPQRLAKRKRAGSGRKGSGRGGGRAGANVSMEDGEGGNDTEGDGDGPDTPEIRKPQRKRKRISSGGDKEADNNEEVVTGRSGTAKKTTRKRTSKKGADEDLDVGENEDGAGLDEDNAGTRKRTRRNARRSTRATSSRMRRQESAMERDEEEQGEAAGEPQPENVQSEGGAESRQQGVTDSDRTTASASTVRASKGSRQKRNTRTRSGVPVASAVSAEGEAASSSMETNENGEDERVASPVASTRTTRRSTRSLSKRSTQRAPSQEVTMRRQPTRNAKRPLRAVAHDDDGDTYVEDAGEDEDEDDEWVAPTVRSREGNVVGSGEEANDLDDDDLGMEGDEGESLEDLGGERTDARPESAI